MKKLIFIVVLFTLFSCKGGGEASSKSNLNYSSLIGYWMADAEDTTCQPESTVSYKPYFSFSEENGVKVFLIGNFFFTNNSCSGNFVGMQAVGYSPSLSKNDVNFNFVNELFIITDPAFLGAANSTSFCGINDWVLGEFKSVQDTVCSGNPPASFTWTDVQATSSTISFKEADGSRSTLFRAPEKNNFTILTHNHYRANQEEDIDEMFSLEIEKQLNYSISKFFWQ